MGVAGYQKLACIQKLASEFKINVSVVVTSKTVARCNSWNCPKWWDFCIANVYGRGLLKETVTPQKQNLITLYFCVCKILCTNYMLAHTHSAPFKIRVLVMRVTPDICSLMLKRYSGNPLIIPNNTGGNVVRAIKSYTNGRLNCESFRREYGITKNK